MRAEIPENEEDRLAALHSLDLLDTPTEQRFDQVTRLASLLFRVPIALVSLVDEDRQWFKSCLGMDVDQTSRDVAFCAHVVYAESAIVVEDATKDPRFHDNPLVTGDAHIRFYAGYPLRSPDGFILGTLCLIDTEPRTFSHEDLLRLSSLAEWIEKEIQDRAFGGGKEIQDAAQRHQFWRISHDLLCIAGADGYFKDVNPSFMSVLGHSRERLLKRPFLDMVHPDDVARTMSEMERLKDGEETVSFQNRFRHKNGEWVWLNWSAVPRNGALYAIARDVTREVQERQRLDRVVKKLQESTKELRDFSTLVSHDLRAPLRAMRANLEPEKIAEQIDRLEHMIDSIVNYERVFLAMPPKLDVDLDEIWEEVAGSFKAELKDGAIQANKPLGHVAGDADQLKEVLHNLVDNSIKNCESPEISIQSLPENNMNVLHYRDNGPGISAEARTAMWQPFKSGSSGIGMPLVKRIVELHGGTIRMGDPTEGAHFIIEFPRSEAA